MSNNTLRRHLMGGGGKSSLTANVGDIAYKASDGAIKVINPDKWKSSLGIPVGVVSIPSNLTPDGFTRIVGLDYAHGTNLYSAMCQFLSADIDTSLNNVKSESTAIQDFQGKQNTMILIEELPKELTYSNTALNFLQNYKVSGAEEIYWYIPALGELKSLLDYKSVINLTLTKLQSVYPSIVSKLTQQYPSASSNFSMNCWSSTEYNNEYVWILYGVDDIFRRYYKTTTFAVRPFAQLDF